MARRAPAAAHAPAGDPRILGVLALAEEQFALDERRPYLADPDAAVRRAPVLALLEHRAAGAFVAAALATVAADPDADVRACARRALPHG
ncbi:MULTISPECIES: hypothetical protein [unclassified Streptomyces]|uniref:hypothetical protein n=1 Tax=unclassified Streptomyces TaxID=2593676 RepID=UPI00051E68CF|nr:hypothetical protein [Streptomyces sp. CNQ-509]AIT42129.1 hypothetical protein [Streptomyces sp. CNQ-509]